MRSSSLHQGNMLGNQLRFDGGRRTWTLKSLSSHCEVTVKRLVISFYVTSAFRITLLNAY